MDLGVHETAGPGKPDPGEEEMPRLRCHYVDCTYLEKGYCSSESVELDPDEGCLTYAQFDEVPADDDWVTEEMDENWNEDETDLLEEEELDTDWLSEGET